jgi:hypothetical protein
MNSSVFIFHGIMFMISIQSSQIQYCDLRKMVEDFWLNGKRLCSLEESKTVFVAATVHLM